MTVQLVNIPWPRRGVSENEAAGDQPELTTREGYNVRNIDDPTGRSRGGQRTGLRKYCPVALGGAKVDDMAVVARDEPRVEYAALAATTATIAEVTLDASTFVSSSPGDTVTIGTRTYAFVGVGLADDPDEVNETVTGEGLALTLEGIINLGDGFNVPTNPVTKVGPGTLPHAQVTAEASGSTLRIRSKRTGTAGNGIAVSTTLTGVSFSSSSTTGGTAGTPFDAEWERVTKDGGDALAVEADRQGNVYVLQANGSVAKYNADGKLLFSWPIPISAADSLVRRIGIDSADSVYVAASRDATPFNGRVWKYRVPRPRLDGEVADDRMDLVWVIDEIEASIADFVIQGDTLALLENDSAERVSRAVSYQQIFTDVPFRAWERAVPHPCNSLAINSAGSLLVVSEPNPERGVPPNSQGFGSNLINWVPHELAHPNAPTDLDDRMHVWLDARKTEFVEGDRIDVWETSKFLATASNGGPYDDLTDDTPRVAEGVDQRRKPRFDTFGFGNLPGIRFDGSELPDGASTAVGNLLRMGPNLSDTAKLNTAAALPQQRALFPGYVGAKWAVGLVVRFTPSDEPSCVLQQITGQSSWTLVANMKADGTAARGYFTLICNRVSAATHTQIYDEVAAGKILNTADLTSLGEARFDVDWDDNPNPTNAVVITIGGGGKGAAAKSWYRVNGRTVSRFTLDEDLAFGEDFTTRTSLGGPFIQNPVSTTDATPVEVELAPFTGWLGELHTTLGSSSSTLTPNDTNVTTPIDGADPPDPGDADVQSGYEYSVAAGPSAAATEIEFLDAYLAHGWGLQGLLPAFDAAAGPNGLFGTHPFASSDNSNAPASPSGNNAGYADSDSYAALSSADPVLAKFSPTFGTLEWAVTGSGFGLGVAVGSDDDVFTIGPRVVSGSSDTPSGTNEDEVHARKVIDRGQTFSADPADGAWLITNADPDTDQTYRFPRLRVDDGDDFYWPIANAELSNHVRKIRGSTKNSIAGGATLWEHSLPNAVQVFGIALAPNPPVFPEKGVDGEATVTGPEFVYVASGNGGDDQIATLSKLRVVSATRTDGGPRSITTIGHVNGDLVVFDRAGQNIPTGGAGALTAGSRFISHAVLRSEVFYTDGLRYKVYDPKPGDTSNLYGQVVDFEAEGAGDIPPRCKLLAAWRDRLVLARGDNPSALHFSESGNPYGWDFFPPVVSVTQAVTTGLPAQSGSGLSGVPDIVNALVPYDEDMLLIGCDSSIYRLTGDPMSPGAALDLVSDITGMAFGTPWTKDPQGTLYFFGARGGVFAMGPNGVPQRISLYRIERQLQDVDLEAYRIRMVWSHDEEGLRIVQVPNGNGAALVDSWFWDRKNDAWFPDDYGLSDVQPTSVAVLDGDLPGDRTILYGCADGFVREVARGAKSDDGVPIYSRVMMGPLGAAVSDLEFRFSGLRVVLASKQNGCHYELFSADSADDLGPAVAFGELDAGRNPTIHRRTRGSAVFLRLSNADALERWAYEGATIQAAPAGRRRVRANG